MSPDSVKGLGVFIISTVLATLSLFSCSYVEVLWCSYEVIGDLDSFLIVREPCAGWVVMNFIIIIIIISGLFNRFCYKLVNFEHF